MDFSHLAKIEQGDRFPSPKFYRAIADFLEMSMDDLIHLITFEKAEAAKTKVNEIPFLSNDEIERIALNDRNTFLDKVGRTSLWFPKDTNQIPFELYKLTVEQDDMLFGINDRRIYAGLFPSPFRYRNTTNVIAVATQTVSRGREEFVSSRTIAFQVLHEVGHYRLDWLTRNNKFVKQEAIDRPLHCSQGDNSPPERQANHYSSAFLMPKKEVLMMLNGSEIADLTSVGRRMCDYFYVERWTLEKRLNYLGIRIKSKW